MVARGETIYPSVDVVMNLEYYRLPVVCVASDLDGVWLSFRKCLNIAFERLKAISRKLTILKLDNISILNTRNLKALIIFFWII